MIRDMLDSIPDSGETLARHSKGVQNALLCLVFSPYGYQKPIMWEAMYLLPLSQNEQKQVIELINEFSEWARRDGNANEYTRA